MMQVKEVGKAGLTREFQITVPNAEMEKMQIERLEKVAKTANIQGFRPGKAPLTLIKQRYGDSVRGEVLEEAVGDGVRKALNDNKLRPAMQPKVDIVTSEAGKDFEFKITVDVLPEVKLGDFSKISLERPVIAVEEAKVIEAITQAAKNMREPEEVTEKRAAKMGDIVVIDFDGSVDGERQPGMKADDHQLELGSKSFIDTFEEQIAGMKVGDEKDIKVTFPKDYHAAQLAGKKAVFAVKLKALKQPKKVELNDEMAKELGFDTFEALKKRVTDDFSADYVKAARTVLKRRLLDKLADTHKFDVPAGLLENEFNGIWAQVMQSKARKQLSAEDAKKSDDELKADYRKIAERRIRLGLVLAEVGDQQKITVTPPEIRDAMLNEARRFPGQEQAVINYYTKTEGALEGLRAPILEEKTVDYILSQTKIADKAMTVDELIKLQESLD